MIFTEEMRRLCGISNNIMAKALPRLSVKKSATKFWGIQYNHNYVQGNLAKIHHNAVFVMGVFSSSPTFPLYF